MKVTGVPARVVTRRDDGREGLYKADEPVDDPGYYVVFPPGWNQRSRSGVECPYCRGDMFDAAGPQWARVKVKNTGGVHLLDLIPSSHQTLICRPCRQVFTSPKETTAA